MKTRSLVRTLISPLVATCILLTAPTHAQSSSERKNIVLFISIRLHQNHGYGLTGLSICLIQHGMSLLPEHTKAPLQAMQSTHLSLNLNPLPAIHPPTSCSWTLEQKCRLSIFLQRMYQSAWPISCPFEQQKTLNWTETSL
ncbi:hypothetical protein BC829DRAFT_224102 [Chytridium lagenaria]|nr:hypothetical protein BC829DRAFT_224102 [Chytridium lagenaria]